MSQVKLKLNQLVSIRISDVSPENLLDFELKENSELEFFWHAADFLKTGFDEFGGFPNAVKRKIDGYETLDKGWYGSMVQGQSMSVLSRAYFMKKFVEKSSSEEYL